MAGRRKSGQGTQQHKLRSKQPGAGFGIDAGHVSVCCARTREPQVLRSVLLPCLNCSLPLSLDAQPGRMFQKRVDSEIGMEDPRTSLATAQPSSIFEIMPWKLISLPSNTTSTSPQPTDWSGTRKRITVDLPSVSCSVWKSSSDNSTQIV